jgi:hypothetical protein
MIKTIIKLSLTINGQKKTFKAGSGEGFAICRKTWLES